MLLSGTRVVVELTYAVDLVTLMDLATQHGGDDVGDLWQRNLAAMGVKDDGSG